MLSSSRLSYLLRIRRADNFGAYRMRPEDAFSFHPFLPTTPALTSKIQCGLGPRFLLLLSAPASGGFMAEAVGTCQGSPLRFDR